MDPSELVKYFDSALHILAYLQKESWCTSMVILPEELSFLYEKKGGPKQGWKRVVIGQLWPASGDRLAGQLSPGCLANTRQTSLTNEGPCLVHWGNLSTS